MADMPNDRDRPNASGAEAWLPEESAYEERGTHGSEPESKPPQYRGPATGSGGGGNRQDRTGADRGTGEREREGGGDAGQRS